MARRYDSRTTIFSPDGRLYQVEYAMEAISHAGTCLGIVAVDGIVLAAECRNTNPLLDSSIMSDKIHKVNEDTVCAVAGITSDANVLINELRANSQRYLYNYGGRMPCEQLVSHICDIKQSYTQIGGKRPFGVSLLYMGWDEYYDYQLYMSDPSGNYSGWKGVCIGNNFQTGTSMLTQELTEDIAITLDEAKQLAIKVLCKTLDTTKLSPDKIEMATLKRIDNKTDLNILSKADVEILIENYNKTTAKDEDAKKEKPTTSAS